MTSQVNPDNIDGTYPVAGQDNDSQGFRDNFTNIRNNFSYIKQEVEDLQSKSILIAPLSNTTLNNDMLYAKLVHPQLSSVSHTYYNVGGVSLNQVIGYNFGNAQELTTGGSIALSFIDWPTAGQFGTIRLIVRVTDVAHTLTLPDSCMAFASVSGTNGIAGSVITFPRVGVYVYEFSSADGGVTVHTTELTANNISSTSYKLMLNGQTVVVESSTHSCVIDSTNSATLASLSVEMPTESDGKTVSLSFLCPVTALTTVSSVKYLPSDFAATGNVSINLTYSSAAAAWLRI